MFLSTGTGRYLRQGSERELAGGIRGAATTTGAGALAWFMIELAHWQGFEIPHGLAIAFTTLVVVISNALVRVGKGRLGQAFEDWLVRKLGGALLVVLLVLGAAAPARAQVSIKPDIAVGGGFMFSGDEGAVFSTSSLYGAAHWNGVHLPWLDSSTGIGVELHPATVQLEGGVVSADYRVWSLNRVEGPSITYGGTDLKIGQGGDGGWVADFDQRVVVGFHLAELGSARLQLELYALEDDRPVSACFLVRWGGTN